MKSRLVLWGSNQNDEKILVALELIAKVNKVQVYSFGENIVTELFYNRMINEWRMGDTLDFPEGFNTHERQLSATDDILPEEIKVERTDLIARAKTEWHFTVLSSKLYEIYHSELEDIGTKIGALTTFDEGLWEELKGFWSKVQKQVHEKNLFREHINELRNTTNQLFDELKSFRKAIDEEFKKSSQGHADTFFKRLEEINAKINEGLGLQPLFEKLKSLQNEFKDSPLTRKDRSKVWKKLDQSFKTIKEKKFGGRTGGMSNSERIQRRFEGLLSAIKKMERSIGRDIADKNFQDERIEVTDGQLEMQIRQAKIKMIEERINSKKLKLEDMLNTKVELEKKIEKAKERELRHAERTQKKQVELEVKDKIASQIVEASKEREADQEKLTRAANEIKEAKSSREEKKVDKKVAKSEKEDVKEEKKDSSDDNLMEVVGATLSEAAEDMIDTVKAVAEVVKDKIEDKIEEIVEDIKGSDQEETGEDIKSSGQEEKVEDIKVSDKEGKVEDIKGSDKEGKVEDIKGSDQEE